MSFETGRWFLLCGIISHHKGKYKQWAIKRCQPWRAPTWANWPLWTTTLVPPVTLVPVVPGHFSLPPAEYERTEQYLWSPATNQEHTDGKTHKRAVHSIKTNILQSEGQLERNLDWFLIIYLVHAVRLPVERVCQQATQELTSLTAKVSPWLECYISGKIQLTKLIKALHAAP